MDGDVCDRIDAIIRDRIVPPRSKRETKSLCAIGNRLLRYLPASLNGLSEAVATATVHSAALVGSPEAMTKLAAYANDSRNAVQEALLTAWPSFDLERYAEEVLADAPLNEGITNVESVRFFPHLFRLRHLKGVDVWLPPNEPQFHLRDLAELPSPRYLYSWVSGDIDLSPLAPTKPHLLQLMGAKRYSNLESIPEVKFSLGLYQQEPWRSLDFLRGRRVRSLHLSGLAPDCDPRALTEVIGLRAMYCENWYDAEVFSLVPTLTRLTLKGAAPIDLRPLRDRSLTLALRRRCTYVGVDELGPDVKVEWRG
ncbi:hypothetical protein JNUCC0626_26155 [Lentzea sp. JNUCC 0626]|uniref:hypothetical protein n=1 Tax=Lentzea sp. JNUCC 0626 TaxID=3367513 RepID=UPI0037484E6F